MTIVFADRREAGRVLAGKLGHFAARDDVTVLALPRGGVPVAYEVAQALKAPLDVFVVRKLGVPGYEELAMGAIATSGVRVLNDEVVEGLAVPPHVIDAVAASEERELLRRERLYRGERIPLLVDGRIVILVDDGLATGSTMRAAVRALRQKQPARIVAAVPVGSPDICEAMESEADEVVCATTPQPLIGVGRWYEDFSQTSDDEVRALLVEAGRLAPSKPSKQDAPQGTAGRWRKRIVRLSGDARDYDQLLETIGEARFVLLGEASHGTHEFYEERARITQRLIEEKGFAAVAIEADWPDTYRVNRYVQGAGEDIDAEEALADFRRFPTWMWRNRVVVDFVEWLRRHNEGAGKGNSKVGLYGLDLYALHGAMKAVLRYLEKADPAAAQVARRRYACFDHFGPDPQAYGFIAGNEVDRSCQEAVVAQLVEMLKRRPAEAKPREGAGADELFAAQQNARLVKNAEAYYRAMFLAPESTWNLRDRHMAETFEALAAHLRQIGRSQKIVVWAHNSHLGDARATDRSLRGEINLGQLIREKHEREVFLVGFTTYQGTVTAASDWDGPADRKAVRPALARSYEALLHSVSVDRFQLDLRDDGEALPRRLLERAIGVIYRPETERASHCFHADLAAQFDALLHFDETRAVEPLERSSQWDAGELAETYPFGV
ncbi:erythromycin esterase family protein [Mesorhizobium sp. BR1-1-9]|uniref:erythromycin esterase family protein n=1 Tax=unclassified Mesorhizobium TaxID=325217 RepID=UPI001CD14A49|nr:MULTISPECIES: erythromycin esterase family protein [unclassified Mesorhizobium]MBZ9869405.1 erythromycin esterase family protein [Mesorhizobium sp. BR1-1-9]MBZ9940867.1 erythromycin esterase family protein [Mesorhizobium sp. BR1-1-13]